MDAPVGTVLASMLEEAQFQAQPNIGRSWALARGQSAVGTKYAAVTGKQHLPDLRGVFLRGGNADLSDAEKQDRGNPEHRQAGEYQADELKSHHHNHPRPGGDSGGRVDQADAWYGHFGNQTEDTGGLETRPRNVTINFFIRFN